MAISPLLVLFILLYATVLFHVQAQPGPQNCSISQNELNALHLLYESNGGTSWNWFEPSNTSFNDVNITANAIWFSNPTPALFEPCLYQWQGLVCTLVQVQLQPLAQYCNITSLSLPNFNLVGTLPDNLFGPDGLSQVDYLDIDTNSLEGRLPQSLYQLYNLSSLYVDNNQFSGSISTEIGNLIHLTHLDLQSNSFSGPIPTEISKIISLVGISLYVNSFNSTIPYQWSTLTNLQTLSIDTNDFVGTIPSQFSKMTKLTRFYCYSNHLTGSIPSQLSELKKLQLMYFNYNHLVGTMPLQYSTLTNMQVLYFFGNSLTGTIPSQYSTLVGMKTFLVKLNMLSGTIPNQFSTLTKMVGWGVGSNMLTGTVPSTFGRFYVLDYFKCYDNSFHGTLPDAYSTLMNMSYLNFAANSMTGTLPVSYSNMKKLKQMFLFQNMIEGTLPAEYSFLPKLQYVYLGQNYLEGTIPISYTQLHILINFDISDNNFKGKFDYPSFYWPQLTFLNISYNQFTGPITLNASNFPAMQFLDLSHNKFRNKIPGSVFESMEDLRMISLSYNCLDADLPDNICKLKNLETLLLDKVGSECDDTTYKFFSSTKHMPSCYWEIASLTTLHSIGNGLLGTLGDIGSNLTDVAIMSNLFTGNIPRSFQISNTLTQLILSFNRFDGTLSSDFYTPNIHAINFTANRLSGDIPPFLLDLAGSNRIDIIGGNLFMCDKAPINDVNHGTYQCGSQSLTISGRTYIGAIFIVLSVVLFFFFENLYRRRNRPLASALQGPNNQDLPALIGNSLEEMSRSRHEISKKRPSNRLSDSSVHSDVEGESLEEVEEEPSVTLSFICSCDEDVNSKLSLLRQYWRLYPRLALFNSCIINWSTMVWNCLLACFLIGINSVSKKDKNYDYSTHMFQYGWLSSFSFSHGWGPVILICVVVFISIMTFFSKSISWSLVRICNKTKIFTVEEGGFNYRMFFYQFINIVIVCIANFFYIDILARTTDETVRNALPFILGFFKAIWGLGYIDFMMKSSKISSTYIYINELFATLFVFFISPLLLIAVTEFNCYYYAWHNLPKVSVAFPSTITDCNTVCPGGYCQVLCPTTFVTETTSVQPPWIYGYQCGSSIIVSYTPVVLNSYLISGIIVPVFQIIILATTTRKFRRDMILNQKLRFIPLEALFCLTFSRLDLENSYSISDGDYATYYDNLKDIRTSRYLATTSRDIVMIITFGIASPFIIFIVLFTLIINDVVRRLQLGSLKYDLIRAGKAHEFEKFIVSSVYRGDLEELYKSQTIVMILIILAFWAILCYDMIADIYGNTNGLITMFVVALGVTIVTIIASYYVSTHTKWDDIINNFFQDLLGEIRKAKTIRVISSRISSRMKSVNLFKSRSDDASPTFDAQSASGSHSKHGSASIDSLEMRNSVFSHNISYLEGSLDSNNNNNDNNNNDNNNNGSSSSNSSNNNGSDNNGNVIDSNSVHYHHDITSPIHSDAISLNDA